MVIMTAKVSKRKITAIILLIILIVAVLAVLLTHASGAESAPDAQNAQENTDTTPSEVKTNDDRVAYLASFGWEVGAEPIQTQEVRIPTDPSEVFQRYNELQVSQGFDLSEYAGKSVRRYVYAITNYPTGEDAFYATLLVYKNEVIGGDVCSSARGGVMHGLAMPG